MQDWDMQHVMLIYLLATNMPTRPSNADWIKDVAGGLDWINI